MAFAISSARLFELVRYMRRDLYQAKLISAEELAALTMACSSEVQRFPIKPAFPPAPIRREKERPAIE